MAPLHAARSGLSRRRLVRALPRVLWILLVAVHLWPFARLGMGLFDGVAPAEVGSLLLLLGVVAIFALKAADVPFLRVRRPGVGAIAFVLAACIAHGEVVVGDDLGDVLAEPVAVAVAGLAPLASRRVRRRIGELLTRLLDLLASPRSASRQPRLADALSPGGRGLASALSTPARAPPIRFC